MSHESEAHVHWYWHAMDPDKPLFPEVYRESSSPSADSFVPVVRQVTKTPETVHHPMVCLLAGSPGRVGYTALSRTPIIMRRLLNSGTLIAVALLGACRGAEPSAAEKKAIAAEIEAEVRSAYDLKKPDVEKSLETLYADTGRIVSASSGTIIASRDTLFAGIHAFWKYVGSNMRDPKWMWDRILIDVLSRDAAVMTATYHVPHLTPTNMPHVIGGAWTAVFRKENGRWVIVQEHLSDLPPAMADSAHAHMKMPPDTAKAGVR
jgi:hypothetical protein